jgi:hypothetical protein
MFSVPLANSRLAPLILANHPRPWAGLTIVSVLAAISTRPKFNASSLDTDIRIIQNNSLAMMFDYSSLERHLRME